MDAILNQFIVYTILAKIKEETAADKVRFITVFQPLFYRVSLINRQNSTKA